MPRARCTFRQRDLKTAVETARAAGLNIGRVEIDRDGKIAIFAAGQSAGDDLDSELKAFEAKHDSQRSDEGTP